MVPLKEDGTLDIERINKLPIDEYIDVIENLTSSQHDYYVSTIPLNDGSQHTEAVFVDYTLEDELKRGAVNVIDYINQKREKYGIKKQDDI